MARLLSGGTLGNNVLLFMEERNRKNCPREEFDRFSMTVGGAFGVDEFVLWFLCHLEIAIFEWKRKIVKNEEVLFREIQL